MIDPGSSHRVVGVPGKTPRLRSWCCPGDTDAGDGVSRELQRLRSWVRGPGPDQPRPANNARFLFLDRAAREFYHDWERQAQDVVAALRRRDGGHLSLSHATNSRRNVASRKTRADVAEADSGRGISPQRHRQRWSLGRHWGAR
ncbi:MAG TPA: hypothetical protein VHZ03_54395 [Trebonia sp.]|nr:hypothetical protein [Trebonia sp.]